MSDMTVVINLKLNFHHPFETKSKVMYEKWLMSSICDMICEPMIFGDVDTYVPV